MPSPVALKRSWVALGLLWLGLLLSTATERGVAFLTYGGGVPGYVALWLPLAPALVLGLRTLGVPRLAVAVVLASTLPTFLRHDPPAAVPQQLLWLGMVLLLGLIGWWLVARLRSPSVEAGPVQAVRWPLVGLLVLLVLALRVPLAFLDPGTSDIPRASEAAARALLAGDNPYLVPNENTIVGTYQYPAGSILAHLPFVAAAPVEALGERWLGARAAVWATDVLAVVLLALAGARLGRARAGLAAALTYALHPTLVRESGLTATNDLMLAVAALGCALLLARRRPWWAGAALGVAMSIKPAALVALPVVAVAGGWGAALVALAVPAALQLPFLALPRPGLHGVSAIVEPAGRLYDASVLQGSLWWPLYEAVTPSAGLLRVLTVLGIAASFAAATWAGRRLRGRPGDAALAAAAVGLPLLVSFATATDWRLTFQDWYLPCLVAAAVLAPAARTSGARARRLPVGRGEDGRTAPRTPGAT